MSAKAEVEVAHPSSHLLWPWLLAVGLIGMVGLLGIGALPRLARTRRVEAGRVQAIAPKRVVVATVARGPAAFELTLPGSVAPIQSSVVYSRGAGFVRRFYVDLGDVVKTGQVLAEIAAPEIDEDAKRAHARVEEADKNAALANTISTRSAYLAKAGVSSQQESEETKSRLNSARAQLDSARADADRIGALRGFSRVSAAFDGVVTRRMVEVGTLVSAGQTPLFELAQVGTLKVTVDVPQSAAPEVRVGGVALVFLPSAPQKIWTATVKRTAGALDAGTRTLRTELHLINDGTLLAGSYVQVRFKLDRSTAPLVIAASALSVGAAGPRVWTVVDDLLGQKAIQLGRDLGKELEVAGGLVEGERVVLNPTDALQVGARVEAVAAVARAK